MAGFGDLPEGIYQEGSKYFHKLRRLVRTPTGFEYELVPRECTFTREIDEELIHQARERAARAGIDFYDTRVVEGQLVGWLHGGKKRSQEWPANLGSAAQRYEREPVPDDENPDRVPEPEPAMASSGKAEKTNG